MIKLFTVTTRTFSTCYHHTCGQKEQMVSLSAPAATSRPLHPRSAAYCERRALWPGSLCLEVWWQTLEKTAKAENNLFTDGSAWACQVHVHVHCIGASFRCVTFDRAAEGISPACVVDGASTCPGETDQSAHSIWPLLKTGDHLFHLGSNVNQSWFWWPFLNRNNHPSTKSISP